MERNRSRTPTKYRNTFAKAPLQRTSLTEIAGNKRVLIEHHKGIGLYSADEIDVISGDGSIRVKGKWLQLEYISGEKIVICGEIFSVTFTKEANHDTGPC